VSRRAGRGMEPARWVVRCVGPRRGEWASGGVDYLHIWGWGGMRGGSSAERERECGVGCVGQGGASAVAHCEVGSFCAATRGVGEGVGEGVCWRGVGGVPT